VSGCSNVFQIKNPEISESENLASGKSGSITNAIAANLSVVLSSSFEIYFQRPSSMSFDESKNVRSIANMIAICAYPKNTSTQTKYVKNDTNSDAGERAFSLNTEKL